MNKQIKKKCVTVALFLLLPTSIWAQNYGALEHLLQKRPANEKFTSNKIGEHLFFSAGLGTYSLLTNHENQDGPGIVTQLYVGKWITPVHGIRLGASLGYLPLKVYAEKARMTAGSFDYLLNMSALTLGYNENRRLQLLGVLGAEAGLSQLKNNDNTFYYGVHAGVQGNVRLSRTLSAFVEPRIGCYNDKFGHTNSWRNYKISGSLLAGITYTPATVKPYSGAFDNHSFTDHWFFSSSSGIGILVLPDFKNTLKGFGYQFSAGAGKWFSPTSALRLLATVGFTDTPDNSKNKYLKHAGVQLDYLWNISNALWGYKEGRFFNWTGIAGINLSRTKGIDEEANTTAGYAPGVGIGMQGSFRLNHSVDLFIEPRFNMYSSKYASGVGPRGKDRTGEVNIGLTYHILKRPALAKHVFRNEEVTDNMFMTSGIGAQIFLNMKNLERSGAWGPQMSASVGKWFSPYSGLRLTAMTGMFYNYVVPASTHKIRHATVNAGIDYLWNITSAVNGYNPDRKFEWIGTAGVNISYASHVDQKYWPGINASIQGLWHLTDFIGLYVEPQVRMYSDKFIEGSTDFIGKDIMASINAGVHYRFAAYSKATHQNKFGQDDKRYFVSGSLGINNDLLTNINLARNIDVEVIGSLGKWYTPLSAWRVSGTVLYKPQAVEKFPLHYVGLGVDYMMSLGTLAKGYIEDKNTDVVPFIGFTTGVVHRRGESKVVPGIDAGAQFKVRMSPRLDLYVEPRVGLRTDSYDGLKEERPDRVISVSAGLSYKFNMGSAK